MGHVGFSSQSFMRTYLLETLLKADKLHTPEKGDEPLFNALPMCVVSLQDAQFELFLTGKRSAIMRRYMDRNGQLEDGRTIILISDAGDSKAAIHRRLGAAGQLLGKNLIVKRQGMWSSLWKRAAAPRRTGAVGIGRPAPKPGNGRATSLDSNFDQSTDCDFS